MNEVLKNLWSQIGSAGASVKWTLAAIGAVLVMVSGFMVHRAQNPHFVVLAADLDTQSFNSAVKALANADIRYQTSMGPEPYVIQVESGKEYEARTAIHLSGEFLGSSRGITSGLEGSSSVFLGQSERHQRTQKRLWEEAEMQLERLNYVAKAKVIVSGGPISPLAGIRADERRASVTLTLRGLSKPTPTETRALVGIVRGATGVDDERITITDQHSNVLYDGLDQAGGESLVAIEERFARERSEAAQRLLDRVFGPGVTVVGVTGKWRQVRQESVSEELMPAKKPRSSRSRTVEEPEWPRAVGGPAGVAANTQEGGNAPPSAVAAETSTTSEQEELNSFGTTTTHTVEQPHQLERISVSLVVDESMADRLADAEKLVKGLLGFDETRGDRMESTTTAIPALERNAEGAPVLPEPVKPPKAANPVLAMALEFGLEIVAGIAFLIVLLRSLKSARTEGAGGGIAGAPGSPGAGGAAGSTGGGATAAKGGGARRARSADSSGGLDALEEDVDLDALARAHIEDLLREQPEKVSALLSRWALSEDPYAETGSR